MNRLAEARFGKFFDELLAQNDLTAAEAARRLHVSQSQTSRWRRGEGGLSYTSLHRISQVFGTDLDYLLELAGMTHHGPSVYDSDDIEPTINVRLDAIRQRLRELLTEITPALWPDYLEQVSMLTDALAVPYEHVSRGPRPKVPTRARRKTVSRKSDRDVDRERQAPLRPNPPAGEKPPAALATT